mgnify:FL=1
MNEIVKTTNILRAKFDLSVFSPCTWRTNSEMRFDEQDFATFSHFFPRVPTVFLSQNYRKDSSWTKVALSTEHPPIAPAYVSHVCLRLVAQCFHSFDAIKQTFHAMFEIEAAVAVANPGAVVSTAGVPVTSWSPNIAIHNSLKNSPAALEVFCRMRDGRAKELLYCYKFCGVFSTEVNLMRFPFDVQPLRLSIFSTNSSDNTKLHLWALNSRIDGSMKMDTEFELQTLEATTKLGVSKVTESIMYQTSGLDRHPLVHCYLLIGRKSTHVVSSVIVPLWLLTTLGWAAGAFVNDDRSTNLALRMDVLLVLLLTVTSYKTAISTTLPGVSYITAVDVFIFGSLATSFVAVAIAVADSQRNLTGSGTVNAQDTFMFNAYTSCFVIYSVFVLLLFVTLRATVSRRVQTMRNQFDMAQGLDVRNPVMYCPCRSGNVPSQENSITTTPFLELMHCAETSSSWS